MTVEHALVVGCDAGGSSVCALAWRDGAVVGRGNAGPANAVASGIVAAADSMAFAVLQVAEPDAQIAALYVGAAGAGRVSIARALEQALRDRLPRVATIVVEDDTRIALRAAIPEGPGVVVIAGTGSVAYAESGDLSARIGGAGYLVADEGSAFAIGRAAIRLLTRAYDGRERPNETTRIVERALGVSSRDALLDAVYAKTRNGAPDVALIAALAPSVVALAAQGESASGSIVRGAAADLTLLVTAAARGVQLTAPRVTLAGGVLQQHSVLADLVRAGVEAALPRAAFITAAEEPAMAAVRLALAALASKAPA